jgi:transposase
VPAEGRPLTQHNFGRNISRQYVDDHIWRDFRFFGIESKDLAPGKGEKMSKHSVTAGDIAGLMVRFAELHRKAAARTGKSFPMIVIQEAGFDGFWAHRVLQQEGIESHVVDPASIAVPRRGGGPKPTRSTGRRCCGRFWLIHAASRVYVRWWSPLRPRKKIGAGSAASATH